MHIKLDWSSYFSENQSQCAFWHPKSCKSFEWYPCSWNWQRRSPSHTLSCARTPSFCRFQTEQDRVQIPSAISSIPRSQARWRGLASFCVKPAATHDAPRTADVTTLYKVISGTYNVLFTVHTTSFHWTGTSSQSAQERYPLEVVQNWRRCVSTKNLILDSQTLVHYAHTLPLLVSCDASSYRAGAVLSHKIGGQFLPVNCASCSFSSAQQNYSQLEKEALSIIFGLKRFLQYLYGSSFTILTDHRLLLFLDHISLFLLMLQLDFKKDGHLSA